MILFGLILAALFVAPYFRTSPAWAKGDSSSSQSNPSSTTTTTTQDNRVAADSGGVALGQGASLTNVDNFSDNVKEALKEALQLARDAGEQAVNFSQQAIKANENATAAVAAQAAEAQKGVQATIDAQTLGSATVIQKLAPFVVVAIIGVFLIMYGFGGKSK